MSYDLTGRLYRIFDTEQVKETFRKREFVIEKTDGQYPNFIKLEFTQDRCDELDKFQEGQDVTVSFDLRGREWNEKFFTNLSAWRIVPAASGEPAAQPRAYSPAPQSKAPAEAAQAQGGFTDADEGDLPF